MERAAAETTTHTEEAASAPGPEPLGPATGPAGAALLRAAARGRHVRGLGGGRALPRLSNAGVAMLARQASVADRLAAAPFENVDDVVYMLAGEAQDESTFRADTHLRAFAFLALASLGDMEDCFRRTQEKGGFARLVTWADVASPRVRVAIRAWRHRGQGSRAGFEIEHRDDLAKVSPTDRAAFLGWIGQEAGAVTQMRATEGYMKLSQEERDRLDVYVGGGTSLSEGAVTELQKALADTHQDKSKAATFRKFLHAQKGIAPGVRPTPNPRLEHVSEVGDPVDVSGFSFKSGKADAVRHDVKVGEGDATVIPVYLPKNDPPEGLFLPSLEEIVTMLASANEHTRRSIAMVRANPGRNPEDRAWAGAKGMTGFRSFMTAGADGVVDIYPQTDASRMSELRAAAEHESGHVVSMRAWGNNPHGLKWAPWREAMRKDKFAASSYAKTGILDDFAEAWAMLMEVEGTAREKELEILMPNRYKVLKTLL